MENKIIFKNKKFYITQLMDVAMINTPGFFQYHKEQIIVVVQQAEGPGFKSNIYKAHLLLNVKVL